MERLITGAVFIVICLTFIWVLRKPLKFLIWKPKTHFPPCANWNVWAGKEIEGHTSIGRETLFVRRLTKPIKNFYFLGFKRVWFCHEFTDWDTVLHAFSKFEEVCVEVNVYGRRPPRRILEKAIIYWKLPIDMKRFDHICVGKLFADESFMIGTGNKVNASKYCGDRRIA